MKSIITGVLIGAILFFLLTLIKKDSKYSKLGINLKRNYCPKCNLKQPLIRKPKNKNQMLYGGNTCKNCNTEMDKFGVEIKQRNRTS